MTRLLLAALLFAAPAFAQQQPTQPQGSEGTSKNEACQQANATPPAGPVTGPNSGTDPRNSGGSTGWSGAGLGGSHTGTTPSGSSTASNRDVEQPAVASGLDLSGTAFENGAKKC
jgi:hypothetical protein